MVTIETISIVFTGISISLAAFYYINTLRNTRKNQDLQLETRQAGLFMEMYREYRGLDFRRQLMQVRHLEWTDFDDWWEKYGPGSKSEEWANWQSVAAFFSGVGVLVKRNLVDISMVDDLLSNIITRHWVFMEPIIMEWRERTRQERSKSLHTHELMDGFEYLYLEHQKYMKEHPELHIK
jgi:hypothetical protein